MKKIKKLVPYILVLGLLIATPLLASNIKDLAPGVGPGPRPDEVIIDVIPEGEEGIINGGFEQSVEPGNFKIIYTGDNTSIHGWTVDDREIDIVGELWQASEGNRSIDLNGAHAGAISTTVNTEIGSTYSVKFDMSGNPAGLPKIKTLYVRVNNEFEDGYDTFENKGEFTYNTFKNKNTFADMKWQEEEYTFVAKDYTSKIAFESASTRFEPYGPAIDNVRISYVGRFVPETKDDCKNGGWAKSNNPSGYKFSSREECLQYVENPFLF